MNNLFFTYLKSITWLIILFSITSFAQEKKNYTLLWKIEHKSLKKPSYLFGTMHVRNSKAFEFSDAVMPAIENCQSFALEVHPDTITNKMFSKVFKELNDSSSIFKETLNTKEYNQIKNKIKASHDIDFDSISHQNPRLIKSLLEAPEDRPDDKNTFVDAYLYGIAKTLGKSIHGLEKFETQLDLIFANTKEKKEKIVYDILNFNSDLYKKELAEMTAIYNSGDIDALESYINSNRGIDSIMISRNNVMTSSIIKLMKNGPTFSAVGAAHLPGSSGIIDLLRIKGYTVTPVEAKFTGVSNQYKIDPNKIKGYDFIDDKKTYSISYPGKPYPVDFNGKFKIQLYTDLMTSVSYGSMSIFFPIEDIDKRKKLTNVFVANFSKKGTVIEDNNYTENNSFIRNILIKESDQKYNRVSIIFKNNHLYSLFTEGKMKSIKSKYVDFYFNSFKSLKTELPDDQKPIVYNNKHGAFSVDLPNTPKEILKEIPNPLNPEGDPYKIKMYMSTDIKTDNNYLVRYNDMPFGYYAEDTKHAFTEMENKFSTTGKIIKIDTIEVKGYEGRQYEVLMQNKYHTVCKVFFRGNRCYLLMHQKLNAKDKASANSKFFNSFAFKDYQPTLLKEYKTHEGYQIKTFEKNEIDIDSTADPENIITKTYSYQTKNNNSGGTYLFQVSELKDFYRYSSLEGYYEDALEVIPTWKDSIIKINDIKMNNIAGKEFYLFDKNSKSTSRHQIVLYKNHLLYKYLYGANEELNSTISDEYFSYFEDHSKDTSKYNLKESKTKAIISGLKSNDSILYNKSIEAFNYYPFYPEDANLLHNNLTYHFKDGDSISGAKCNIINALSETKDSTSINHLKNLYQNKSSNSYIKATILTVLTTLENTNKNDVFLELISNDPPIKENLSYWNIISPLKDSISFSFKNFHKVKSLLKHKDYRNHVLQIVNSINELDTIKKEDFIHKNLNIITKYTKEDFNSYKEKVLAKKEDYIYSPEVYNYLRLFSNFKSNDPIVDWLTINVLNLDYENASWYKTLALKTRILNNLSFNNDILLELLSDKGSRLEIMKMLDKNGLFKKIPKKYLETIQYSELNLSSYLYDDTPDKIELLGTFTHSNKIYHSFSLKFYDDIKYIAVVGPITKKKKINICKDLPIYFEWEEMKVDWKKQSINLIKE